MIDQQKVRENLDEWLENPSWKEVYDGAPSSACRKYISMMFYASETESEEAFNELDRLENELDMKDTMYMYDNTQGPQKKHFYLRLATLRSKQ